MIALFLGIIHYYMKLFGYKKGIFKDDCWYLLCFLLELMLELTIAVIISEICDE